MFLTQVRPAAVAVQSALDVGPVPHRLIGIRVRFPDIGSPVLVQVGLLRFPGERPAGLPGFGSTWAMVPWGTGRKAIPS